MRSLTRLESFSVGIVTSLFLNPRSFEAVSNRVGPDLMLRFPGEFFGGNFASGLLCLHKCSADFLWPGDKARSVQTRALVGIEQIPDGESMRTKMLAALVLLFLMLGSADEARTSDEVSKPDAAASGAMAEMPALAVPEGEFNFGEVSEGKEYVHDFVIKNGGTGILEIKKVNPG